MKYIKEYHYTLLLAVLSIASFFVGISLKSQRKMEFVVIVIFLLAIVTFIYGVVVLIKNIIKKSGNFQKYFFNISAILIAMILLWRVFVFANAVRTLPPKPIDVCNLNLTSLGKAILMYANDNDGYYSDCNQWCDLMIIYADTSPKELICYASDAEIGESSFAMNINLNGKKPSQIEPNTVVLFDTIYGKDPNGRNVTVSSRYSYKIMKERGENVGYFGENPEERKVYKNRWNQAGGPEMLSAENHKGEGANILFADGSVRYMEKEDFNNLSWGQETTEPNIE